MGVLNDIRKQVVGAVTDLVNEFSDEGRETRQTVRDIENDIKELFLVDNNIILCYH